MTPIPQSVHDRARRLAEVHPLCVVAELIGHWPSVVSKMKRRGWRAATYETLRRHRPADFAVQAARLCSVRKLAAHYGTTDLATIVRWKREMQA